MTEKQLKKTEQVKEIQIPPKKGILQAELSTAWFVVLSVYILLFIGTGYLTFFYNNTYATNPTNMAQIRIFDPGDEAQKEKFDIVKDWIKRDNDGYNQVNQVASQAFNVVLGAILAFLAATASKKMPLDSKKKGKSRAVIRADIKKEEYHDESISFPGKKVPSRQAEQ